MASFMNDLAKPYVEKLINGAIAESSYICCFTCIAEDFEEEKARLEKERSTVKQRADVATSRGEVVQANALSWEEEADNLIQEDTKTKQRCLFGFCPHIIWRYKRGKELTNKKEQMKRLIETGKELSIGLPARLPDVERYSSQHYIPFKSRESKYKELLDALKDDNNYVIGLKGMGGTGKTTLAKEVGKELKQSKQFTKIIDATVSFSPDIKKIQDDIAGPLGLKFDDCNESDRPKKLWSRLTNGEKILLILDDVWGDINFVEIGIPDCDNHKGCSILVTTRSLLVCNRLGCSKTIQLDLLSEEDAWIMFKRHSGLSEISTKNLLDKGRKIANECKRLPIAIAAIASSLNGIQRLEEWEWALKSLKKHTPMPDVDDDLYKIYKCLKFSYDYMKNEKAKKLFLLCSVFQEDEKIPTERLTRLGIGGGLFADDFVSYEDARTQVVISKNKLLDSCLLLEADQNRVKMHDLVRDAAQWIANKKIQTVKLYDKNQKAVVERETNIKYLLCECKLKDVFSFKLDGSRLEILIVTVHEDEDCHDEKIEVPNSFFENILGLRVFHLIHHHYSKLALSLPHSIQSLKNIRSLLFTRVNLGGISILGILQSLETLDLDYCKIDGLPHGITKLEKLKLLNLNRCEIARNNPFEVIEGCSSLEELYFTGSFNDFCGEITLPKLQRFNIDEYSSSVDESSSKRVSVVFKDKFFLSETTLKYCMQEAEVLRLGRIEGGWRNIIPEIVPMDHGINDLVELRLNGISQLQYLIDTKHTESQVSKVFSKLVVLELWNLDNLVELFNGPLSFDSLNSLEKLSIYNCKHLKSLFKCNLNLFNLKWVSLRGCPMLISVFQLSTARSLTLLERLEIDDCGCLEYIIDERKGEESRGEIVDDNESTSQGSIFQKLEVLSITKCPELEFVLPFLSTHDLPALEYITIESCDKLKYIFGKNVKLGSLKDLMLNGIPNLEGGGRNIIHEMIPMDHGMNYLVELHLGSISQLQCLIDTKHTESQVSKVFSKLVVLKLQGMDNLEELFNGPLSFDSLNSLEKLSIKHCKHLKSLFKCNLNLFNLKSVSLEGCPMLISLFQIIDDGRSCDSMFQKLEVLSIKKCPELEIILPFQSSHDLPALESITAESCDKLKYIFGQDVQLGSLKKMEIGGIPNFIDIFPECNRTMSLSIKKTSSISGDASEPQEQSEPIKCNIYCCGKKYGHRLRSTTRTKTPLISKDQPQDNLMKSNSYCFNIWECAQCLSRQSHILCNIKEITLKNISKMKSVFILSIAPRMLLETLSIDNCDELKHIIIDMGDHDNTVGNNWGTVFPKLRKLQVYNCEKLEYIIGRFTDDHQNHTEIHLHLSVLETFVLLNLPSLVSMCPKQYHTTFPPLKELELNNCGDGKIIKELSGNMDNFLALESLVVNNNSKVESIICLNEINEQQMNLALKDIDFDVLPMMTCLFVGPNNSFSLRNLIYLKIKGCEKLKIVFPTSIVRCLPQLYYMRIEECNELKHIIEDGLENTTKTCFPKLRTLVVIKCNKLKYVFPISICKELPVLYDLRIEECKELKHIIEDDLNNTTKTCFPQLRILVVLKCNKLKYICKELPELRILMIREADELEEIFVNEGDDHKVEIPNLKAVIFENLPSLYHAQGIQFQAVKHRFILNCQKLSLASAITADFKKDLFGLYMNNYDPGLCKDLVFLFLQQLKKKIKGHNNGNENPETSKKISVGVEVKASSEHELTSPKELMNEKSMDQQRPLGETDTAVKPSQLGGSTTSEKNVANTCSTNSPTKNEPPIQVSEISVEEGTTSANTNRRTATSQECGDGKIAIPSPPIAITNPLTTQDVDINLNDDQVSLNDDSVIKVASIVEEQLSKDVEFKVPESKLSSIISSPQEFQTPSMLSKGDPSQNVEDLSSSLFVKSELEQLVSKNHLDHENLSLLTGFLVKNPSVHLKDNSLRNRYKGCAYNLLAELLKFLETHSVLDVLGSCHSEFAELLLDARNFGFDKDWLDSIERRAMFPDIQISQDAMQKLLDFKQQVTKEVEVLHLKIEILSQHVEDLKHQLTSSKAVLNNIIQQEAVLSTPIGY